MTASENYPTRLEPKGVARKKEPPFATGGPLLRESKMRIAILNRETVFSAYAGMAEQANSGQTLQRRSKSD